MADLSKNEINISKLRSQLIQIYESYLGNPNDAKLKRKAKEIHNEFLNALPLFDKALQHAINLLVDIAFDLPSPPKPSKETVEKLIEDLRNYTAAVELSKFLVKAKISTYASQGEQDEQILDDECKQLSFSDEDFTYRDRYYGFNPFIGEEIVWRNKKIIWGMNYFGKIVSKVIPEKQVYKFLQTAMRQVMEDRPFRGPSRFKQGDLEYLDKSEGDINQFKGTERILYQGKEIYKLEYHGGLMN